MATIADLHNCFSSTGLSPTYYYYSTGCDIFAKCDFPAFDASGTGVIGLWSFNSVKLGNQGFSLVFTPGAIFWNNSAGTNIVNNYISQGYINYTQWLRLKGNTTPGCYDSDCRVGLDILDYLTEDNCTIAGGVEYLYPSISVPEYCSDSLNNGVLSVSCTPPDSPAPILPTNCRTGENLSGELIVECEDGDLVCPVGTYLSWSGTGEAQCLAIQGGLPKTNDTAAFTLSEETVSYIAVIILVLAGVAFLLSMVRRIWK